MSRVGRDGKGPRLSDLGPFLTSVRERRFGDYFSLKLALIVEPSCAVIVVT